MQPLRRAYSPRLTSAVALGNRWIRKDLQITKPVATEDNVRTSESFLEDRSSGCLMGQPRTLPHCWGRVLVFPQTRGLHPDAVDQRPCVLCPLLLVDFRSSPLIESPLLPFGNKCLSSFTCAQYHSARDTSRFPCP